MDFSGAKKFDPEKPDRTPIMKPGPEYDEVDVVANIKPKREQDLTTI